MRSWRVGELAAATGVTVRTLHHYDALGLVRPSGRTKAGYRIYAEADVTRLQEVLSLREFGLSLEEIRERLDHQGWTTLDVLKKHLARLEAEIEERQRLRDRVQRLIVAFDDTGTVAVDELIQTMRMMIMFDKYYTKEQLEALEDRRKKLGEDRIREVEAEWPRLIAEVQAEYDRGTDPADERMQALSERWIALVREFSGGDPGIENSLRRLYENEESVAGMDVEPLRQLQEYVGRAIEARERTERP